MVAKGKENSNHYGSFHFLIQDFPIAQMVKNLPARQETWVQSLGQEDPLEKEMAILPGKLTNLPGIPTAVFLPGESHGQRSLAGYSPRGHKESDTTK